MGEVTYSKIVSWEVWNFMSIKHARCEFDERNIINLKGYNDSGKSAMLTALKVCLTNSNPTKQVGFIMDDEDYFRVLVTFDDGVMLLRDKYRNGQSLYELYKGDTLAYTTKTASGALVKVNEVPEPIAQYLGLIEYDKTYLNFRSCFEKQVGVQTTGSENYKMFNTVLKSEEIATAATLLNNDKNKLLSDLSSVESEISANRTLLGSGQFLKESEINYLKEHDSNLDRLEHQEEVVRSISSLNSEVKSIVINPELKLLDSSDLNSLNTIKFLKEQLETIKVCPEVDFVDSEQLSQIASIKSMYNDLSNIKVAPEVNDLDLTQLQALQAISGVVSRLSECNELIKQDDTRLEQLDMEITKLQEQANSQGARMIRCPNCGEVINADDHVHQA